MIAKEKMMRIGWALLVCAFVVIGCMVTGTAVYAGEGAVQAPAVETPKAQDSGKAGASSEVVKEGDLVLVNYTASMEDGTLIYSTVSDVAREAGRNKAAVSAEPTASGPEEVVAGKPAKIPAVGESVVGMKKGEKKHVTVPAESAFGPSDPKKIKSFPSVKTHAKTMRMSPPEFVENFRQFPIQGQEVSLAPFLKARITEVTKSLAVLDLLAKDGEEFKEPYGTVVTTVKGDEVTVSMTPLIGAPFKTGEGVGKIASSDGKSFTVDCNPPVAGKRVVLDMEVVDVKDTSALDAVKTVWVEDIDRGLSGARAQGKPSVVLLYADWCKWCKKLLTEVFPDPRIKAFGDRLVWIKVNSDKQPELQKRYEQNGFPLVLLFDKEGQLARRIEGFADAVALKEALGALIAHDSAKGS